MKTVYYFVFSPEVKKWEQSEYFDSEKECWRAAFIKKRELAKVNEKRAEFCPINFCSKQVPAGA